MCLLMVGKKVEVVKLLSLSMKPQWGVVETPQPWRGGSRKNKFKASLGYMMGRS